MKIFMFRVMMSGALTLFFASLARAADEPPPASPHDGEAKVVFQKYLPSGDQIVMSEQSVIDSEQNEWAKYSVDLKTRNDAKASTVFDEKIQISAFGKKLPAYGDAAQMTLFDVTQKDKDLHLFYSRLGILWVDTVHASGDNEYEVTSHTQIRRESPAFGEISNKGCLVELGGNIHVIVEYNVGTQELWRIDGDKATLLWRLGYEELKRQKEKLEENTPESATSGEYSSPPVDGSPPPPPGAGRISPPASDTGRPPATGNTALNATGTGTSSQGGAEGTVAEAAPFPWAIVIVAAAAALSLGAITTLLLTRKNRREAEG